jgi:hypothetical protein
VIIGRTWLDADQARAGDALGLLVETRKGSGLAQKELAGRLRRGDGRPVAPRYLNAGRESSAADRSGGRGSRH